MKLHDGVDWPAKNGGVGFGMSWECIFTMLTRFETHCPDQHMMCIFFSQ